ncbi:MAG TPA: hypothetical protein DEB32_08400, partial [Stenotrophomonas sp.]|nr:hypothetical protein [Stenotrophomonas sp.]
DQEYRNHRAERSKPKITVSDGMLTVRRAPAPNIIVLPNGHMKIDEIEIPLDASQQALLQQMFGQLQVLRQNTLTDAAPDPAKRSVRIQVPEGMQPIPPDLVARIPEFKDYTETFDNLQADRH